MGISVLNGSPAKIGNAQFMADVFAVNTEVVKGGIGL